MYINEIDFEYFTKDVVIYMPENTLKCVENTPKCVSIKVIPHLIIQGSIICTHFKYEKYEFSFTEHISDDKEDMSLSHSLGAIEILLYKNIINI